jgi:hypothetical protein
MGDALSVALALGAVSVATALTYRIATSCRHNWEVLSRGQIFDGEKNQRPIGHYYHMKCKKCGRIKKKEL